jgi:mono/diheme cytochrome c family protein
MCPVYSASKWFLPLSLLAGLALAGCGSEPARTVSYKNDIKPLFEKHCLSCHAESGAGQRAADLRLDSYENLMAGGKYGPVVVAGKVDKSPLVIFIHPGADAQKQMPMRAAVKLSKAEIGIIEAWVAQGAKNN